MFKTEETDKSTCYVIQCKYGNNAIRVPANWWSDPRYWCSTV